MPIYNRKDSWYRRAKEEGYRSRAAYKLLELDQKHKLFRRGQRVLDLGCAPGGWLQVAFEKVGPSGLVVGIDRLRVEPLSLAGVTILEGDLLQEDTLKRLLQEAKEPVDVVLSDMAPNTSGVAFKDHALSMELVRLALTVAKRTLKPGGHLVAKVFDGPDLNALVSELKKEFGQVQRVHADTSRKGSKELYLVAKGLGPQGAAHG